MNYTAQDDFDAAKALIMFGNKLGDNYDDTDESLGNNSYDNSVISKSSSENLKSSRNHMFDFEVRRKPECNKWTTEDDVKLAEAVKLYGENDWKNVSDAVGTKDKLQCRQRWQKVIRPGIKKGKWTEEEDALLIQVVQSHHKMRIYNWRRIAEKIPNRTSKQCRERWNHHLSPDVSKDEFTPEEDQMLAVLLNKYGAKWSKIAKEMPGRTENSVRARCQGLRNHELNGLKSRKASLHPINTIPIPNAEETLTLNHTNTSFMRSFGMNSPPALIGNIFPYYYIPMTDAIADQINQFTKFSLRRGNPFNYVTEPHQ